MITGSQKAYQYAIVGAFRVGASRVGYVSGRAFISIGGIVLPPRGDATDPGVLYDSVTIQDLLNERPNTCSFKTFRYQPPLGAEVVITLGTTRNPIRLFGGYIVDVQQGYQSIPDHLIYHVSCLDWGGRLGKHVLSAKYVGSSASGIVADLMATWAPAGYTFDHLEPGLPALDEITFTNERLGDCLNRIAARVGAYWYIDYQKDLHFFTTDHGGTTPLPLTPAHPSLDNVSKREDLSQLVTRVHVEGGGGNAAVTVPPGATSIPVDVGAWYEPTGGTVVAGPQRIAYTGVEGEAGGGSLVGPGVTPTAPLTAAAAPGSGITDGTHLYAYTWVTASGETKPAPLSDPVTHGAIAPPPPPGGVSASAPAPGPGGMTNGGHYRYKLSFSTGPASAPHASETLCGDASPDNPPYNVPTAGALHINVLVQKPAGVRSLVIYRNATGTPGTYYKHSAYDVPDAIPPGTWINYGTGVDTMSDVTLGATALPEPAVSTARVNQTALSGIAVGPGAVTARRIYRTPANVSTPLQLLATLADNATTTYTDSTPDGSLGATAPAADTSALTAAAGQVLPGATSMIVASAGWAAAAGGWAVIGNGQQTIRYTGISGNTITGIPASGYGAIVAAVAYNSTITAAPALVGITPSPFGGVRYEITQGDPINLWITVDDLAAQATLGALLGDDGIATEYLQDRRLSAVECRARGLALLQQRGAPLVTLRYTSRDLNTRSGATITAALPPPTAITVTLKAQQVTIDHLSHLPDHYPTFDVTASTERYSLEDLLRDVQRAQRVTA